MLHCRPKFNKFFFIVFFAFLLGGFAYAQENIIFEARYLDGPFAGQEPSGGLEPQANVALVAGFSGSDESCGGSSGYSLFHTMTHAKSGDATNLEYLAKGEGPDIEFEFNSGSPGQKNIYWPVFYCWSSSVPEVALGSRETRTTKQWTVANRFDMTTVGGSCSFSNAEWNKSSASVGDTVSLKVKGNNPGCNGTSFGFEIWRGGKDLGNRLETTINSSFPTAGSPPLTATVDWKVAGSQKYAFKIRLPNGGPDNCARTTGGLCLWSSDLTVGGAVASTSTKIVSLEFKNPLSAKDFRELIDALLNWIFWLAIPIAVIMILFAGITMMGSQGDPEKFGQGRKILLWAVIGLAVIFIGEGFIALIESILNLGK